MFDIGFSELMVIGVVAMVVIGPERMPGVARTAGALFGRAQRYANKLKAEIQSEVDMAEYNRIKATFYDAAKSVEDSVAEAREEMHATAQSLNQSISVPSETPASAPTHTHTHTHTQDAPVQRDFWLDSATAAGPAPANRT